MSEVVDSDEELSGVYNQPNLNMLTNQSGSDDFGHLPQFEQLEEPTQAMQKANASQHRSNQPMPRQNPGREADYASMRAGNNAGQVPDANFLSVPHSQVASGADKGGSDSEF